MPEENNGSNFSATEYMQNLASLSSGVIGEASAVFPWDERTSCDEDQLGVTEELVINWTKTL